MYQINLILLAATNRKSYIFYCHHNCLSLYS